MADKPEGQEEADAAKTLEMFVFAIAYSIRYLYVFFALLISSTYLHLRPGNTIIDKKMCLVRSGSISWVFS
jgi:hypothetical protein